MNSIEADKLEAVARHLPKPVQSKIHLFIDESAAAWAGLNFANQGAAEAHRVWAQAEDNQRHRHQFTKTTGPDGRPVYESRDDGWLADAAPRLLANFDAWQRSKVNLPYLESRWNAYAFLADLRDWLPGNRRFSKHCPVKAKGTDHVATVEKLRGQIADIDQRYSDAEHAPCNADDLIARAEIEVDRLAEIGAVNVDPRIREGSPVNLEWPVQYANPVTGIAAEKLVWLFRDEIKSKLATKIRAETPAVSMTDFERAAELSALESDRLALERQEEAHISAAAETGLFIPRRREANPLAILEIE